MRPRGGPPGRAAPAGRWRASRSRPRSGAESSGAAAPEGSAYRLGERAAALLGDDGDAGADGDAGEAGAEASSGGSGPGGTGLDPPAAARGGTSRAGVLPRAAALASAREAVRRSRERRAGAGARAPAGPVPTARAVREVGTTGGPAGHAGLAQEHAPAAGAAGPLPTRERTRLALRERLPLWVQLRCGIEPKTLLALAVVLVVAIGFAVHHFWTGRPEAVRAPAAERAPAGPAAEGAGAAGRAAGTVKGSGRLTGERLVVDVGGKVRKPGIYRLPSGARVADALKAAGGVRPGTDLSGLNRARRMVDGEQIVAGAASTVASTGSGARQEPGGVGTGADPGGGEAASGGGAGGAAPGGLVSLTSATVEQLETLPGVGPVLAQHIVEYREEHGGFTSVDQLQEVNGIGDRRFADIEPKVSP
jgi:competence protein ComEA